MKEEDLMIGNLFQDKYSKQIIKVLEIKKKEVLFSGNFVGKWQAEPIPLTEETIKLLGFEKLETGCSPFFRKGNFIVDFFINKMEYLNDFYPIPKHVHKLQQLIKSLEE